MYSLEPVITGVGLVSPLGTELSVILNKLENGISGITENPNIADTHIAKVTDYDPLEFVPKKQLRRMETANHYAINAVGKAIAMAEFEPADYEKTGIIVGTGFAGFESVVKHKKNLLEDGIQNLRPVNFPTTVYNATAGMLAIQFGLKGVNTTITGMDIPSEFALLYASILLKKGDLDRVIVVGVDASIDPLLYGLDKLKFLSKSPKQASKAFEGNVNGINMGEGAAAIVLETASSARLRNIKPIAQLNGIKQYSSANEWYNYNKCPENLKSVLNKLLAENNSDLKEYDLISLSSNGAHNLDKLEQEMLKSLTVDVPCTCLSDYIGSFPGAGLMRLAMTISTMKADIDIKCLQDEQNVDPFIYKLLNKKQAPKSTDNKRFIHVGNGVGGTSIAIDLSVA